jgi:hypothetical protein
MPRQVVFVMAGDCIGYRLHPHRPFHVVPAFLFFVPAEASR